MSESSRADLARSRRRTVAPRVRAARTAPEPLRRVCALRRRRATPHWPAARRSLGAAGAVRAPAAGEREAVLGAGRSHRGIDRCRSPRRGLGALVWQAIRRPSSCCPRFRPERCRGRASDARSERLASSDRGSDAGTSEPRPPGRVAARARRQLDSGPQSVRLKRGRRKTRRLCRGSSFRRRRTSEPAGATRRSTC